MLGHPLLKRTIFSSSRAIQRSTMSRSVLSISAGLFSPRSVWEDETVLAGCGAATPGLGQVLEILSHGGDGVSVFEEVV